MATQPRSIRRCVSLWLHQGITPSRLALTLALGFALGCIPVVGVPTLLCAGLALALRLNLPAIQAANYAAMPLQLLLIVPFVRLGGWLFAARNADARPAGHLLPFAPLSLAAAQFAEMAIHALIAWLLIAGPAVAVMTLALTLVLRRVPTLGSAQAAE